MGLFVPGSVVPCLLHSHLGVTGGAPWKDREELCLEEPTGRSAPALACTSSRPEEQVLFFFFF